MSHVALIFGCIIGSGASPYSTLISFSEQSKFAWTVRSEKTKWKWKLSLSSVKINVVPPAHPTYLRVRIPLLKTSVPQETDFCPDIYER